MTARLTRRAETKVGLSDPTVAGFTTFLPFKKALLKKRIANDRFTIDSINPKRRDIVIIAADQTRT